MDHALFVLRRAWLFGVCRRSHVDRAFGTARSPNRGSAILEGALKAWPQHLIRLPHKGVFPNRNVQSPPLAMASLILDLLAQGAPPQQTAIFADDGVPILKPEPKPSRAMSEAATHIVFDAALREQPVRILYVGLRAGETARWRPVWPRAWEHTGLFWRLHAQDIEASAQGFPIKVFLLARILDARQMGAREMPRDFRPRQIVRTERHLKVFLSETLTPDQAAVMRNQLDIRDGVMTIPDHAAHAFKREFADEPSSPDIVWPVISRLEDK